jgi:IS5 family transposase
VKTKKAQYRIRNWADYNKCLVSRGNVTVWISDEAIKLWYEAEQTGKRGHPKVYGDEVIELMMTLGVVYRLALRQTEGFLNSILGLMKLDLKSPCYSSLSRRRQTLKVKLPKVRGGEGIHLLVDSTGLKVYGEGEWKMRQHGKTKKRTWTKVHLAINQASGIIEAVEVTDNSVADHEVVDDLLEPIEAPIETFTGDGSYDTRKTYDSLYERKAKPIIPPQKNARIWQHGNSAEVRLPRDQHLRRIRKIGRKKWKQESGYHQRSKAETTMFRLKHITGSSISVKSFAGRAAEIKVRCAVLNKMTALGRPLSYPVA